MYNCVFRTDYHKQSFNTKILLCINNKVQNNTEREAIACDELGNIRKYHGNSSKVIGNFTSKK